MENYKNCVNSHKIKHSTVPHWTSGSSNVFKRIISNKKSRSIVMSEEVKSSNLIGILQSSRSTGMTQLQLRSWSWTSFNLKDCLIAWSASYLHHWLETKWYVKTRMTLLLLWIAFAMLSSTETPGLKSLSEIQPEK
jgi:hypothetical protein